MESPPVIVQRSPSSHGIRSWINLRFICTPVGALELAIVAMGLLELALLGSAVSSTHPNIGAYMGGLTFYVFLFMVVFWCFMTSIILLLTSLTSFKSTGILFKTTFFSAYHAISGAFYLISSSCLLAQAAYYGYIYKARIGRTSVDDIRGVIVASGALGIISSVLYIVVSVLGVLKYKKS